MNRKTLRPRVRDRITAALAATGAMTLLAGMIVIGTGGTAAAHHKPQHNPPGLTDPGGGPGGSGPGGDGTPGSAGQKAFVCKYITKPGGGEVLQSGDNPIWVSVNAIKDYAGVGSWFNDGQGKSYVLAEDDGVPGKPGTEPSIDDCPSSSGGPTEVTPLAFTASCPADGGLIAPANQSVNVDVDVNPSGTGPGTYTITYTPDDGFQLVVPPGSPISIDPLTGVGTQTVTVPDGDSPDCDDADTPTLVSPAVSFVDPTCPRPGRSRIRGAVDTAGIDYTIAGTPGLGETVTVAATANSGFAFPAGTITEWQHTFSTLEDLDCDEVAGEELEDVCRNIDGVQVIVPVGMELEGGRCVDEDIVAGVETERPDQDKKSDKTPDKPVVAGVAEEIPTAVDAGFVGPITATASSTGSLLGQGLVGGGLMLLLLAGWLQKGRLARGAHQF